MKLSCKNFKIRKLIEGNCKILCICVFFKRNVISTIFSQQILCGWQKSNFSCGFKLKPITTC